MVGVKEWLVCHTVLSCFLFWLWDQWDGEGKFSIWLPFQIKLAVKTKKINKNNEMTQKRVARFVFSFFKKHLVGMVGREVVVSRVVYRKRVW